ncbi:MAG TPA: Crp/Fnr family transcriptional regulator [Verrucomicrobiae bacterium]|nr:Crp/Fnr family transcriptional regulator [Verrucomicrobiae bacterium]
MVDLKKIALFSGLSPTDFSLIKAYLREKSFPKGAIILSENAPCERIFIVQSGRIKLYRMTSSGREQILEILGPGDTCACNPGSMEWFCNATAEAMEASKVWFLARDQYVRMVQTNSKVSLTLNKLFADKLRCFGSLIEEVSLKDTKKRLVKFILDMPAPGSSGAVPSIRFTQEELAQRIGAARETIARHLQQLKKAKLIDIKPRQILILDRPGLEKLLA